MSMITELIKKLRIYQNLTVLPSGVYSAIEQAADTIEELSDKLRASQIERSILYYHGGWIPVEKEPPENGKYLVQEDDGDMMVGVYTHECGFTFPCYVGNIAAWRPLPGPYSPNDEEVE